MDGVLHLEHGIVFRLSPEPAHKEHRSDVSDEKPDSCADGYHHPKRIEGKDKADRERNHK